MVAQVKPKLRDYQQEDVQFILDKKHVGLFNEMRTGKTATALNAAKHMAGTYPLPRLFNSSVGIRNQALVFREVKVQFIQL